MKNIPFHQFQRYETAKSLVNDMRQGNSVLKILEVGAGVYRNLEAFLPNDEIVFLEKNISKGSNIDGKIVCGDATDLEFEEDSFDIVIALDVYEHIPLEKRDAFLKEIARVARIGIIISAPFASELNYKHEKELLECGKSIFATVPTWLSEHQELGLPDLDTAINKIKSLGLCIFSFGHGDANLSNEMLKAELLASTTVDGQYFMTQINNFYNRYVYDDDFADIAVRNFIVGLKEHKDVIKKIREKTFETEKKRINQAQVERITSLIRMIENASIDNSKPVGTVQLFYANNYLFSEEASFVRSAYNGYNKLEFDLLENVEINTLRLDPLNKKCVIKDLCVTLESVDGYREHITIFGSNYAYKNSGKLYFNTTDPNIVYKCSQNTQKIIVEFILIDEKIEKYNMLDILLVTYNHEKYVGQAIESILEQNTSFPFQIIVCDDASSDRTVEIINEYAGRYTNLFKILPKEANMGITKNYVRGFTNCTSNFIAVLEGDDYWIDNNRLEEMVLYLNDNTDCSMCFNKLKLFNETTGKYIEHDTSLSKDINNKFKLDDLAEENFIGNFSCCLYRRDIIKKIIAGHNNMVAYDWLTNLECAHAGKLGYIAKKMSVYRIHDKGVWSGQEARQRIEDMIKTIDEYDAFFSCAYHNAFMKNKNRLRNSLNDVDITKNEKKALHVKILQKILPKNIYIKTRAIYHILKGN